jgi:hypothetical protein
MSGISLSHLDGGGNYSVPESLDPQKAKPPLTPPEQLREDWRTVRRFAASALRELQRFTSMRIWREGFSLKALLRWDFIGYMAAAGLAMLGLQAISEVQSLTLAEVCFIVAGLLLLFKVAWFAIAGNYPFWERAIYTFVLFGLIGIVIVELVVFIEKRRPGTVSHEASPNTLHDQFLNYQAGIKMGPRSFLVKPPAGELPFEVEARIAFHFEPHGLSYRELVVYIPPTREMPYVLQGVIASAQTWADDLYDREAASARVLNLGKTPVRRVVVFHVSAVWHRRAEVLEQQGHKLNGPRTNMEIP